MTKGSDNLFPSVLLVEGTVPASPASGDQRLYIDSTGHQVKRVNSSGTIVTLNDSANEVLGTDVKPAGLTGATAASRYVGATTSGAPVSGTFAVGDWIIDQTGRRWTCTAAGTPGTWAQEPGTGGGGGAMTQLADVLLGVDTATFDLTSISGAYNHLRLILQARGTDAAQQSVYLRFNNDSGATYDYAYIRNAANTPSANAASGQTKAYILDAVSSSSDTAGVAANGTFDIPNYAGTSFFKGLTGTGFRPVSSTTLYSQTSAAQWHSTAAITRITLALDAGSFKAGSRCTLYGLT